MKHRKIIITLIIAIILATLIPYMKVYADSNTAQPSIYSEAAILVDTKTGKILYNKNAKERKYPASTTKILTAIVTIENCNLDDVVVVDYDSIMSVPSGYTIAALQVGEELTVKQLLQVLLVHSANDAANVLAKHVGGSIESFASMMNTKANEIGCQDSHFLNPSGKHEDEHYTTAYDLALIMKYCMDNPTFREIASSKKCTIPATNKYNERTFSNTNELISPDAEEHYYKYAIAGKTGYTSEAKNCLVSMAKKNDLELICVVLGGLKTDSGASARFADSKTLYEYGYNTYTTAKISEKGSIAKQIEIENGTNDTKNLNLLVEDDMEALIKQKDLNSKIEPEITIKEDLSAPISQGEVLGEIKYNIEGIEYTSKLTASHSVEKSQSWFFVILLVLLILVLLILCKLLFFGKNRRNKRNY